MLKEGDVIQLEAGHTVYIKLPAHFCYSNRVGQFDELSKTEVTLGEDKNGLNTDFLLGEYIVTATNSKGGGTGHGPNDVYPDGHYVECVKSVGKLDHPIKVSFYQSGSFTAMIPDIKPHGRATATWAVE